MTFSFYSMAACLRRATGWRRAGLAFLTGSVMALSMPPFDIFPLLWVCLPALIFLLQGTATNKQAFTTGWCFAFGFFVCGLYWIAASMFVDIAVFWWAVPLAVAGLPAFFALYYGIAAVLARRTGLSGISGAVSFALLWFLADYARGHCFTGFPWNLEGYAWSGLLPVLQITSVIGIYGLTLLTCVAASLPAAWDRLRSHAGKACIGGVFLFVVFGAWGALRLQMTPTVFTPDVRLRVVQPDIDQAGKWKDDEREAHFQQLIDLSDAPGEKPVNFIFWPETASTFYLGEDPFHRRQIAQGTPPGSTVITGVIRRNIDKDGAPHFYNSLVVVNGFGQLVAGYDKAHLVPFGEFMPWRKYIPLRTLAFSGADFTPGTGPRSLRVLGLPLFSPLICYEAIFPGAVIDDGDRPDFLVNITNDGWYGKTTGPYQHFAISRVRAIEEGLPLVRADNPGISSVTDGAGRIIVRLGLGKRGFIDSDLPQPLPLTFFARWREAPLWLGFSVFCLYSGLARRKKI